MRDKQARGCANECAAPRLLLVPAMMQDDGLLWLGYSHSDEFATGGDHEGTYAPEGVFPTR